MSPTRFAVVKTGSPNFYKLPTPFVVKTDYTSIYKPPRGIAVVKTDSPNFYKPPRGYAVVKTDFRASTSLLHVLRLSNRLSALLPASYTLCGGKNGLYVFLQASYTFCGNQDGLYKPPTRFSVVNTDSPSF